MREAFAARGRNRLMGQYVQGVVFDRERMTREIASGDAAAKMTEPTDDYTRYLLDGDVEGGRV